MTCLRDLRVGLIEAGFRTVSLMPILGWKLPLLLVGSLAALGSVVGSSASAADVKPLRIALVSDPHVTRGTAEDQPMYRERFDKVIDMVNAAKVDIVLIAGDLTQGGKPEEIEDFQAEIKKFKAPVRYVYGNHDVGAKHIPGKEGGVTTAHLAHIEKSLGPSFWTETVAGARIVGVNGSLFGSGLPREEEQWAFLERELTSGAGTTLLLIHYPPFLEAPDEPGGDYWNIEPTPRARLLPLLHRGGVRAVLCGHLHYPLMLEESGMMILATPPVSFGLPRESQPEGWTLVSLTPANGSIRARTYYLPKEKHP